MKVKFLILLVFYSFTAYGQIESVFEFENSERVSSRFNFRFGDRIFFETPSHLALWVTDGTTAGTKRIEEGPNPTDYFLIGDQCFITSSKELYQVDPDSYELELIGEALGDIEEVLVYENDIIVFSYSFFPGNSQSFIQRFNLGNENPETIFEINQKVDAIVNFNDGLLWSYGTNLVYSDGTINGDDVILQGDNISVDGIDLTQGKELDGHFIFALDSDIYGVEPWITDGSADGTSLLIDINTASLVGGRTYPSSPSHFFNIDNELFFVCYDETFRTSLFKTDGTTDGTQMVFSFSEEFFMYRIYELYQFNEEIYFEAAAGDTGYEIWKTDGTLQGTKLVKDIWKGSGGSASPKYASPKRFSENYIYFPAHNGQLGIELWRTDGSEEGTGLLADLIPGAYGSRPIPLGELGDYFYFTEGDDERGHFLYRLDQTAPLPETPLYEKDYEWFETIGYNFNTRTDNLYHDEMEVDQIGNTYLIGEFFDYQLQFYGSENFLQMSPEGEGYSRKFLVSYDNNGQFRWAKEVGGSNFGIEQSLAIDMEGNVICGGVYDNKGVIGSLPMTDSANRFFLAKFASDGELIWKRQANVGYRRESEVNYVETDKEGNIYVGGCFTNSEAQFGPHRIEADNSPAFFAAKYDKDGNELWLRHLPYPSVGSHGYVKSLQVYNDNLYVVISNGDYGWNTACDSRNFDIQLYILDAEGHRINEKHFQASDLSFVTDAQFSPDGYLHLIGTFKGDFSDESFSMFTNCNSQRGFMIILNPDLSVIDAFTIETERTFLQEIEFGDNSTYYLSGRQFFESVPESYSGSFWNSRNKTFVKKYDKHHQLLDERYFDKFHYDYDDSRPLIEVDANENIILSERYITMFDTLPVSEDYSMKIGLIKFSLNNEANYPKDEKLEKSAVFLFPNPTNFEVALSSQDEDFQDASIQLFDASGRLIESPLISYELGLTKIDVRNLSAGLYFVKIKTDNGHFTKKFIKIE